MEVAYILVECRHGKLKIAASSLRRHDEVEELHEVFGRCDLVAKIVCEDRDDLKAFIQNKLQIAEGIRATETLVVSDLQNG